MKLGTGCAVALAALVMASLLPGPALAQGDPPRQTSTGTSGRSHDRHRGVTPGRPRGRAAPTPEPPPEESVLPTIPPVATLSPPPLHLWFESGEDDSAAYLEDAEAMLGASHELCRATPMDLVFVLDGSRSVLAHNFVKVKHFVNALVDSFQRGAQRDPRRRGAVQQPRAYRVHAGRVRLQGGRQGGRDAHELHGGGHRDGQGAEPQ
uniref:Uncharacterized protein LOC116945197 n=1 Tax=Petromyzon marinus TaxID=7757 RepID=A0AAJ7TEU8_PETMA|nr:uncharacterized protein LOC116945197 [Petromyzon marinus]XP_032815359.1 uncharacterized protein LOC116945197 [Petromyzon marinus]